MVAYTRSVHRVASLAHSQRIRLDDGKEILGVFTTGPTINYLMPSASRTMLAAFSLFSPRELIWMTSF